MRPILALVIFASCLSTSLVSAQDACRFSDVLLIVDRSRSMLGEIDGQTKWDIARVSVDSVLEDLGGAANFGLMIYPGPSGLGAAGIEGPVGACRTNQMEGMCTPREPMCSTGEIVVEPAQDTRAAIMDAMVWPDVLGDSYTPTWQSLEAAANFPALIDAESRDFVILLTDGWQCCGVYRDEGGTLRCEPENRNLVVERVTLLRERGVTVFVVGFGGSVDVTTLQRSAVAAGTQRNNCNPDSNMADANDLCYFQANDQQGLGAALEEIGRIINVEICDQEDNDCDGAIDEGVANNCGDCGDVPVEVCNATDDDCDGMIDEGLRNACGGCGDSVPAEVCDGMDNDCDGATDEDVLNACGRCGPTPDEVCNGLDDDCDGTTDEGTLNACGACGDVPSEACNSVDDDCDGQVDEGFPPNCEECPNPTVEVCNDADDDCDGQTDEGLINACGECAPQPAESCNGLDEDCDGRSDEGEGLCPDTEICRCGGCVGPCQMNECPAGAQCINGFCIVDRCPEGQYCRGEDCVEGQRPDAGRPPSMGMDGGVVPSFPTGSAPPSEDCGCDFTEGRGTSAWWLLLLAFYRPRKRRRHR